MHKLIILLIINFVSFSSPLLASDYEMPIGIPDTTIDFTQSIPDRPTNWTDEKPGYYYVDYTNGNDSLTYGHENKPRKTIPKTLPQGSYVEINGEYSYTSGGLIKVYGIGSDGQWVANESGPIWITTSKNEQGSFTKSTAMFWGENIFISDLDVKNGGKIQIGSSTSGFSANNIVVRNIAFTGTIDMGNGTLLAVKGSESNPTTNVILYKNTLSDAGDINATTDIDAGLMSSSGYASNIWFLDNTGSNAAGGGLQINPTQPYNASHNVYAGNNEFYNVRQGGLWVKYAKNVVFSSNYVHDIISTPWSPAKGLGGQYEPNGLWIINNRIHDVEYGIRIPSTNKVDDVSLKVYIIGNVIYDIHTESAIGTSSAWESAGIHIQGADERFIYNNLIYNAPNGINVSATSGTTSIKNNVIIKVDNGHTENQEGYHIWSEHHDEQPSLTLSHNYIPSDELNVKLKNTSITTLFSLDNHLNTQTDNTYTSKNYSGVFENLPLYINDVISNGFNESSLWDYGDNVFTELDSEISIATNSTIQLNRDILNKTRVVGTAVDIGPFEIDSPNPNVNTLEIPIQPSNLTIEIAH